MVEPKSRDQGDAPVTRGLLIATALFIVGFLVLMILAQQYESHWLVRFVRFVWHWVVPALSLGWLVVGIVNFFGSRLQERRDREQRNEGLNGPSDPRR